MKKVGNSYKKYLTFATGITVESRTRVIKSITRDIQNHAAPIEKEEIKMYNGRCS